jgi:hypothetical protein
MQRAASFVSDIIKEIESPCLQVSYPDDSNKTSLQSYHSQLWRGKLSVRAETPLSAAYGVCRSLIAWRGQVTEWLGDQQPRYENRLLWIEGDVEIKLDPALTIVLPRHLVSSSLSITLEERIVILCRKAIEMGFNGLILGALFAEVLQSGDLPRSECLLIDQVIAGFGLRFFIMPLASDESIDYSTLFDVFPACCGVVYRCVKLAKQPESTTQLEKLVMQVNCVRQAVPDSKELLCYLPQDILTCQKYRYSGVWSQLCDQLPGNTTLVFSATAADPPSLAVSMHPFWNELRCSLDVSGVPLLPLLNVGAIGCGGGLWPLSLANEIENTIAKCRRHYFSGVIAIIPAMPKDGSLAHSNLWVTAQRLWRGEASASELMALWFDVYRPDVDYTKAMPLLTEATALALEVTSLFSVSIAKSHEQWRAALESAFARLKNLSCQMWEELHHAVLASLPSLKDCFEPFYVEMRRLLFQLMLVQQVSLPQIVEDGDLSAGFWTKLNAVRGQSVRAGAEIAYVKSCQVDDLPSNLQFVYRSTYFD